MGHDAAQLIDGEGDVAGRVFVDKYINDPILSWKGLTRSGNFASLESIEVSQVTDSTFLTKSRE